MSMKKFGEGRVETPKPEDQAPQQKEAMIKECGNDHSKECCERHAIHSMPHRNCSLR